MWSEMETTGSEIALMRQNPPSVELGEMGKWGTEENKAHSVLPEKQPEM